VGGGLGGGGGGGGGVGGVLTTVANNMKLSNGDVKVLRLKSAASFPWIRKERGF
jgi:hypothetical protein